MQGDGERLAILALVKKYCREVGIAPNRIGRRGIGVHSLRKTAITNALEHGAQLERVTPPYSLTVPADARGAIAVAAFDVRASAVESFSSEGPTFDRRAAASRLQVHPNTLDYRLRRVEALTGLKLAKAPHVVLICLALMHAPPS